MSSPRQPRQPPIRPDSAEPPARQLSRRPRLVGPADQGGVLGQGAAGVAGLRRLPGLAAAVQLVGVDLQVEAAGGHVDGDGVAVGDQADGPADERLGGDMADAGAVGGPETFVDGITPRGNQSKLRLPPQAARREGPPRSRPHRCINRAKHPLGGRSTPRRGHSPAGASEPGTSGRSQGSPSAVGDCHLSKQPARSSR